MPIGFCYLCKELPNKDHATCGKERFIEIQTVGLSQGAAAWLEWVVGFIIGAKL
jgi:hypothetical protein